MVGQSSSVVTSGKTNFVSARSIQNYEERSSAHCSRYSLLQMSEYNQEDLSITTTYCPIKEIKFLCKLLRFLQ